MEKLQIVELLSKEIPRAQIYLDEPMKKHTTFKIGGNADIFIKVKDIKQLEHVIKIAYENQIYITILGNGSNVLVKDNGIRGIVVKLDFYDIDINQEDNEVYIITAGAGVKLGELAQRLLKEEITGMEFASGIPGTIGGAVRMNAGAYGQEMKDIVIETKCLDLESYKKILKVHHIDDIEIEQEATTNKKLQVRNLNNEQQMFGYRRSIFMDKRYIILETKLKLHKGNKNDIKEKMQEYFEKRKNTQPLGIPNAGSTFKRGEDYITAKLIDECGLKGYTIGDAQVSDVHAGFIVNKGKATAEDVIKLVEYVKQVVKEKKNKDIQLEIEILGE